LEHPQGAKQGRRRGVTFARQTKIIPLGAPEDALKKIEFGRVQHLRNAFSPPFGAHGNRSPALSACESHADGDGGKSRRSEAQSGQGGVVHESKNGRSFGGCIFCSSVCFPSRLPHHTRRMFQQLLRRTPCRRRRPRPLRRSRIRKFAKRSAPCAARRSTWSMPRMISEGIVWKR